MPSQNEESNYEKYMFSSMNEFPDINAHKEGFVYSKQKAASEKSTKVAESKRKNVKKIMKTTILNTKKQEKNDESDDYQSTVSRFLWKTPHHVETSNKISKLEAETNSIKRQISKEKSLSLTRDNRYNNLLNSLNDKID